MKRVSVDAEAIGQPGQRRFRLLVGRHGAGCRDLDGEAAARRASATGSKRWSSASTTSSRQRPRRRTVPVRRHLRRRVPAPPRSVSATRRRTSLFAIQVFDARSRRASAPAFRCHLTRGQCARPQPQDRRGRRRWAPDLPALRHADRPRGHVCPRSQRSHAH